MNIHFPYSKQIVKISFVLFMLVTFFGTNLPFQSRMQDIGADEIGTSNIINQLLYPSLFLLSFLAFISKSKETAGLVIKEKYLGLLLLFALVSITWSPFPIVSLKRWFQIFTYYFISITFLAYIKSEYELLLTIKPILFIYIFTSIIVVLLLPEAKDPEFGTWRGLATQKNHLGQISLVSLVLSLIMVIKETNIKQKSVIVLTGICSFILAIGTVSSTVYLVLIILIIGSIVIYLNNTLFKNLGVNSFFLIIITITVLVIALIIILIEPGTVVYLQDFFGKEGGFSDRDRLWQAIFLNISTHPFFGGGFQGFWVLESPQIQLLHTNFLYLPIQAHNGYLDILNDIGIVGLLLFLFLLINYFKNLYKNKINFWVWLIILPLIINITESTFFRTGHITFIFFIIAYLLSFKNFPNEIS